MPSTRRARRHRIAIAGVATLAASLAAAPAAVGGAFAGDNGRIAATYYDESPGGGLITMAADGSDVRALPIPGARYPGFVRWSPDGGRIAFIAQDASDSSWGIWTVGPDGTGLTRETTGGVNSAGSLSWSPDGTRLAFLRDDALVVRDLATGTETRLADLSDRVVDLFGDGTYVAIESVGSWTPDGQSLLVSVHGPGTGFARVPVLGGPGVPVGPIPVTDGYTLGDRYPGLSPDGSSVVWACPPRKYVSDICTMTAAGTGITNLTSHLRPLPFGYDPPDFRDPSVSPDGRRILTYAELADGTRGIVTLDRTGHDIRVVHAPGEFYYSVDWQAVPSTFADADGDGVEDAIDVGAGAFLDGSTLPVTDGTIVSDGGLDVRVEDAAAPDGVSVTVGPGPAGARATLRVCGITVRVYAGSEVTLSCGSVVVSVGTGRAEVVSDSGASVVAVPAGATVEVEAAGDGLVVESSSGDVSAVRQVVGFEAPIDNGGILNRVKAGRAVPLRWRLLDVSGTPVTDLAGVSVTATAVPCAVGESVDPVEETLAAGSGLMNHGLGRYQLNWRSPSSFAGSCRSVRVDMGGGVSASALFQFTR